MENSYWLKKWQLKDIAFHENEINTDLIAYMHTLNLHPGANIFVPLCGKTRDMLWLAEKGFHVIGVELSPIACDDFFAELKVTPVVITESKFTKYQYKNIELFCGDFFALSRSDFPIIHAVYDCKALIALPSALRQRYIEQLVACCGTQLRILLLARETSCQVAPPPFPVSEAEINSLYGSYFNVQQLKSLSINDIPERLIKKGYLDMKESVYLVSEKRR